jgi:hypothetical protein
MQIRHISIFLACLIVIIWPVFTKAQSYNSIVFDQHQSEVFGANNMISLHHALYTLQDKLIPDTLYKENNWYKKTGGFFYRMSRLWLFDAQIDYLTALAQHEVFGHGSCFRQLGYGENSFHINLFFPYGDGSGFARTGTLKKGYKITPYEQLAVVYSGNEGNQVLANQLTANMLIDGSIHYRQATLFLISNNNLPAYIWRTRLKDPSSSFASDDISNYIFDINYICHGYFGDKSLYNIKSLSEQCLISLLNPIQAYSAYTVLVKYGIQGKKKLKQIPMIPLGKVKYLPAFNFSLTPFGAQYHMVNYFKLKQRLLVADIAYGKPKYANFYGINLSAYQLLQKPWIDLNVFADIWYQPELELEEYILPVPEQKFGGSVSAAVYLNPLKAARKIGLYLQLGYKTKGYLQGETLDHSLILRYGLNMKI